MNLITPQQFEVLLSLTEAWVSGQERNVLQAGIPLTELQVADARRVGVIHADRVRLLRVPQIPRPTHPALAVVAMAARLISPFTEGLAVRYGILIRTDCWGQRRLTMHELVHTAQYERFAGVRAFLHAYLSECLARPGYPNGPLEQEAITTAARLCS